MTATLQALAALAGAIYNAILAREAYAVERKKWRGIGYGLFAVALISFAAFKLGL
jgi:hypothetical protein